MVKDLRKKTVKGITWTVISQISRLLINLVVTAILARLLDPDDFGLIAMVVVFTSFFWLFNDMGLSSAVIHKREVNNEELSSAFWVNLLEGLIVTVIFVALAPVIAGFYEKSILKPMVMVLSVTFAISSAGMIQQAIFSIKMDFRKLAIIEITASASGGVTAIVMAATGFGVWSLVAQSLVLCFVLAALLFFLSDWKPSFIMKWKPIKGFLGYGLPLMGFNFLNYFSRNLDNLLIGKYLGSVQLGYYDVAYKSLLFPLQNISTVIGKVMFPALTHLEEDKDRIRSAYTLATRYVALITFPLMAGIAILAPQIVLVVLGPKWERAIFLMRVLALVGAFQSLTYTVGWLYLSQGKTKIMFIFGSISIIFYAGSFIIGLNWEVEGVAVAYAIAYTVLFYPYFAIPFRFIDMKFWHYIKQFRTVFFATSGMALVVIGLQLLFTRVIKIGDVPVLVLGIITGTLCYAGLLYLFDRTLVKDLLGLLNDLRQKAEPA